MPAPHHRFYMTWFGLPELPYRKRQPALTCGGGQTCNLTLGRSFYKDDFIPAVTAQVRKQEKKKKKSRGVLAGESELRHTSQETLTVYTSRPASGWSGQHQPQSCLTRRY